MANTYEFDVQMTCNGCSGAVTRVLTKAKEQNVISSFAVNLDKQEVRVTGDAEYETVLAIITKTGKTVRSGKTVG